MMSCGVQITEAFRKREAFCLCDFLIPNLKGLHLAGLKTSKVFLRYEKNDNFELP